MSVEVWQQAFNIFAAVYTQKCPHEAPALMKYGQTIRDLAVRGQNWRFYDENFRYLRATQASRVPGVQYTGNFGCVHNFQRKRLKQLTKQTMVINLEASQCHLAIVSNFIAASFALL